MSPGQYVNALKKKMERPSIYAVAKALKVTEQSVYAWRDNRVALSAKSALAAARLLKMPVERVIEDMEFWKQRGGAQISGGRRPRQS
jgi:DNA-binding XRE family transcriptional regulator